MIYKQLGSSKIEVSALGLGTNSIGNFQFHNQEKIRNRQKIYHFAMENGINFFDCAQLYGNGFAESILGKTFKKTRTKVIITSKVSPNNCTNLALKKSVENSLKSLGTNYIDLYQIHWINPFVDLEETMTTLEQLQKAGYIRSLGVCNFSVSMISQANKFLKQTKIVSNQVELNLFNQAEVFRDLPYYQRNKITLIGYGVLNHLDKNFNEEQSNFLTKHQRKYKKTLAQIIIRYFTEFKNIILLSRTDDLSHLKNNIDSFNFNLSSNESTMIRKLFPSIIQFIQLGRIKISKSEKKVNNFEILQNLDNLIPSPLVIAQTFVQFDFFKPIKLQKKGENYYLDTYDYFGEYKKYLAWRFLFNTSKPIPAIVI